MVQDGNPSTRIQSNTRYFDADRCSFFANTQLWAKPVSRLAQQPSIVAEGRSGANRNYLVVSRLIPYIVAEERSGADPNHAAETNSPVCLQHQGLEVPTVKEGWLRGRQKVLKLLPEQFGAEAVGLSI